MRSIRLSLLLYFLLLLALALGAVSYFSYQSAQEALDAKEASTRSLWKQQLDDKRRWMEFEFAANKQRLEADFEEQKRRAETKFDNDVLGEARELGKKAALYYNRLEPLYGLGALPAPVSGGPLTMVLPWYESGGPRMVTRLEQMTPDVRIQPAHPDDDMPDPVVLPHQYYQTYQRFWPASQPPPPKGGDPKAENVRFETRAHEASETLGSLEWALDRDQQAKADQGLTAFDEVKLKSGKTARRVTIRVTVSHGRLGVAMPPFLDKNGWSWLPPLPAPGEDRPLYGFRAPIIYLQYGVDAAVRDKAIAQLRAGRDRELKILRGKVDDELPARQAELDRDLAKLGAELEEARQQLRSRLLWVGMASFAALVLGGFLLVWLGLYPLHRLSEAVSQVSEKDFRLPIDQDKLPRELKPIAGRLAATLEQLKRAFGREKQAAADISHELRTPVASLLTRLEIALRKPRSADEYREVLVDCRESGQQISSLVERLLALARLDAGADLLRPRDVDMNTLVDQCAALVRPLAEARGLRLSVHHNGPVHLQADPDKLREVLTNLLHNAIEYNKPDGAVDVRVERNNGHLDMEVSDTGIGIKPEVRQHIFERFYRADPSRQADTPHAGLGLAIVKGYVDLMGGSIDVDSAPGQGSTFRVRLPA
jgi:heavy metal sensor kinase